MELETEEFPMKYLLIFFLAFATVSTAEEASFGIQRFSKAEECIRIVQEHNRAKARSELPKIGLIANSNVCLVITLDNTASTEYLAIRRFEEDFESNSIWRVERDKNTYFWRLIAK